MSTFRRNTDNLLNLKELHNVYEMIIIVYNMFLGPNIYSEKQSHLLHLLFLFHCEAF